MKKSLCAALSILLVFLCTACRIKPETPESTVTVYYKAASVSFESPDGVIAPCSLDATGHENDLTHLLNTYLSNTLSADFALTFPQSTRLVSLSLDALTAKVVLCDEFAKLTGLDLSIACACLTQTVLSLTGCQELIISAESAQLDGHNYITLSRDSYLLLDESGNAD